MDNHNNQCGMGYFDYKMSLVLTILFAALILGEKITWAKGLGAVLMTIGVVIIALSN